MISRAHIALLFGALALPACICAPGHVNCDEGCVDVSTDVSNCGGCGNVCGDSQICLDGACVGSVGPRCRTDDDCVDAVHCNGDERCVEGRCRDGRPVECDDGVMCTQEACVESARSCVATPMDARCGSGERCFGGTSDVDACR